jgi:hypothetical protein
MQYPVTPDGRYFVVRGRLWRMSDPSLDPAKRVRLVAELMAARRAVRAAAGDEAALQAARGRVDAAKRSLGERGPVWWTDGAPDYNRRMVAHTPYANWFAKWMLLSKTCSVDGGQRRESAVAKKSRTSRTKRAVAKAAREGARGARSVAVEALGAAANAAAGVVIDRVAKAVSKRSAGARKNTAAGGAPQRAAAKSGASKKSASRKTGTSKGTKKTGAKKAGTKTPATRKRRS